MKISDQEIVAALLVAPNNAEAAEALQISERQLYSRLQTDSCKRLYADALSNIYQTATERAKRALLASLNCMVEIMEDTNVAPAVRLRAAETVMRSAIRLTDSAKAEAEDNFFGGPLF